MTWREVLTRSDNRPPLEARIGPTRYEKNIQERPGLEDLRL